jgi:hypothetical protein
MTSLLEMKDPKELYPAPPFPEQQMPTPGSSTHMNPEPDYGEQTYRGSGKLVGRSALITGADSGIGRAVALAYAREGADVVISYLNEDSDARETARLVGDCGRRAIVASGDVGDPDHCKHVVERAVQEFGHLDILVNNAAYQMTHQNLDEFTPDELERTFRTNIFSMFYLCQAAVKVMKPGSAIVNTASVEAYDPSPSLLAYAATKAAIVDFTKALAMKVIEQGIRVNAVAPGPVWTPLIPSTMPADHVKQFGSDTLLKRPAQPAELAPIYVLLASSEASYITGMVYGCTGGTPID